MIPSLIKILFPFCSTLLLIGLSFASGGVYTVQTGTYTMAAPEYATRHLDTLSKTLKTEERRHLRIEQRGKFIVVRLGRFEDIAEAEKSLKRVKALSPDAFIVKSDIFEKPDAVKTSEKSSRQPEKEPSPTRSSTVKPLPAPEEYYTVQIGNYLKPEQARNELVAMSRKLQKGDLDTLRIERAGRYFSVRIGRFKDERSAREFLSGIHEIFPGAFLVKDTRPDEQAAERDENAPEPVVYTIKGERGRNRDGEERQIDSLVKDISSQYHSGQYGKAAELLREGIAQWPDNPNLYAWYGATLLNMQHPENALEQYRKAAELSPTVPDYHAGVGASLYYLYMERAKESIDAFKKAVEIDPRNVSALEGLGFVYVSIGRGDLAKSLYDRLATIDKDAAGRLNRAITEGIAWETR